MSPARDGAAVDRFADILITRCHDEAVALPGVVVQYICLPRQTEEAADRPGHVARVAHQIFVAVVEHVEAEEFPLGPPVAHDLNIEFGAVLEVPEMHHSVIGREGLHEATENDIAWIAQRDEDFGARKYPSYQAQVNNVERQFVD